MIHDEELRSSIDYSEGQKRAVHRVLVDLLLSFLRSRLRLRRAKEYKNRKK